MRRSLGVTLVVSFAAVVTVGGIGPAAAQSVSVTTFAKQVCAAVATADQSGKGSSAAVTSAAQAYKSAPSATTAAGLRDAMAREVQNVDQQFAAVLTAIQQAGTPAKATEFVNAFVAEIEAQRTTAQQLAQHVAAVDTTSPSAFTSSFQQVLDETKTDAARARDSAKRNPAFRRAPRPLLPLVRLLTTSADTCRKT